MSNQESCGMKKRENRFFYFAGILFVLTFLLVARTVSAQEEGPVLVSDDEVNAIAKELYCPVCENIPLDVCPTQACAEWREDIRDKLSQGWSEEEIKQYFINRYGDRVVAAPPARGLNWLVYVLPPLFIILGAVFLVSMMLGMKKRSSSQAVLNEPGTQPIKSESQDIYVQKMEEELKHR
jgi:cytochrome c-type biogenesis protein CcmH